MIPNPIRFALFLGLVLLSASPPPMQSQEPSELDRTIARVMAEKKGAVVVLDVVSGKILAAHNLQLAAQTLTAPGSAVKPFVLMELLQSAGLDPQQRLFCRRTLTIAGRRMDCSHSPAVNHLDAADALAYSCNTYFATIAARATASDIARAFDRAGFASRTELVPEEAVGWMMIATDAPHRQLQALGDWGIEVTPLELLAGYRTLAQKRIQGVAPVTAPVFAGVEGSVQYGMAHDATSAAISVAGKTGTAANRSSATTHGLFAGYAPANNPRIVLVVYLEQGRGSDAAAIAGPIFTAYAAQQKRNGR